MVDVIWDGVTDPSVLDPAATATRHALADAARDRDWDMMLRLLRSDPRLVNVTRPGGTSLFAPLHQAAHGGAPVAVIEALVSLGAWRTLQNGRGERPEDVAERKGQRHLRTVLAPVFARRVPVGVLARIEAVFHGVIRARAGELVTRARLRLPPLEPLLEEDGGRAPAWFAIPGMTGGFSCQFVADGVLAKLVSESWSRVIDGSGERHEITSAGSRLVAEGFV